MSRILRKFAEAAVLWFVVVTNAQAAGEPCYYEIIVSGKEAAVQKFQTEFAAMASKNDWGCEEPVKDIQAFKGSDASRGLFSKRANILFQALSDNKKRPIVVFRCNAIPDASLAANQLALSYEATAFATLTLCCPSDCEKRDCADRRQRCMKTNSQKNPVCPTADRCTGFEC